MFVSKELSGSPQDSCDPVVTGSFDSRGVVLASKKAIDCLQYLRGELPMSVASCELDHGCEASVAVTPRISSERKDNPPSVGVVMEIIDCEATGKQQRDSRASFGVVESRDCGLGGNQPTALWGSIYQTHKRLLEWNLYVLRSVLLPAAWQASPTQLDELGHCIRINPKLSAKANHARQSAFAGHGIELLDSNLGSLGQLLERN
jgi:hypothetical protein